MSCYCCQVTAGKMLSTGPQIPTCDTWGRFQNNNNNNNNNNNRGKI